MDDRIKIMQVAAGAELAALRKAANLSQSEMGKRLKVTQQQVALYEHGKGLTFNVLAKYVILFDVVIMVGIQRQ